MHADNMIAVAFFLTVAYLTLLEVLDYTTGLKEDD
jgi:hypothetical protein